MINYFLENNYAVEINLGVKDPNQTEENQIDEFIRESREFIPNHVTQTVEEREILPGIKHNFLVFKPCY